MDYTTIYYNHIRPWYYWFLENFWYPQGPDYPETSPEKNEKIKQE